MPHIRLEMDINQYIRKEYKIQAVLLEYIIQTIINKIFFNRNEKKITRNFLPLAITICSNTRI